MRDAQGHEAIRKHYPVVTPKPSHFARKEPPDEISNKVPVFRECPRDHEEFVSMANELLIRKDDHERM